MSKKPLCKTCGSYIATHTDYQRGFCEGARSYTFLTPSFLAAMNDIGAYGHAKYGEQSFHHRASKGDHSRGDLARTLPGAIGGHAHEHFLMYLRGELHDHFGTRTHQLAAVAFNAMMEHFFDDEAGR